MFSKWTAERLSTLDFTDLPIPTERERDRWKAIPKETADSIIKEADGFIGYDFPVILATDYLEFSRTGDRKVMQAKSFIRRRALNLLVLATCISGDGKYLDTIIDLLFMISEETFWGVSAHFQTYSEDKMLPHRSLDYVDLFAAETGCHVAFALYLLADRLNAAVPGLVKEMYAQLDERILTPIEKHTDWWWQGYYRKVNNWNPWIISNVVTVTALSPLSKERKMALFAKCLEIVSNFTRDYPDDGGCDEGPSYWGAAGGALFYVMEQFFQMTGGKLNFFSEPLIANIAGYMPSVFVGGTYFLNYADCPPSIRPDAPMLYMYGVRTGNENVRALGARLFGENDIVLFRENLRPFFFGLEYAGLCRNDKTDFSLSLDSVLPGLELAVFREAREESKGITVSVKGGTNKESHNHNDVGSLILCYNGSPALIDSGCGTYLRQTFSEERYTIWTMQSGWHNLPVVNGVEEKDGIEFRSDSFKTSVGPTSRADVSFAGAYPKEAGLRSLVRSLSLDRDEGKVTVSDSFAFSSGQNRIEEHLLLCSEPIINGNRVEIKTAAGEALTLTFDDAFSVSVLEKPLTDMALQKNWQRDSLWRLCLSAEDLPENAVLSFEIRK